MLRVARVLFRDRQCIDAFHSIGEHSNYVQLANYLSRNFLNYESEYTQTAGLLLNVTQKLIHDAETATVFVRAQIAKCMLRYLNCREMTIQQAALEILGRVADWSTVCRVELCASTAIDVCLQLIPQGDLLTQKIHFHLVDHIQIVHLGGVSLILAEFVDMKAPAKALNDWIAMITGLCALLAQLCQCDANQYHLVNSNGVYLLGKALLLGAEDKRLAENLGWKSTQCSIFRVLRILFSLERNRGLFKKVFPAAFFEQFIDIVLSFKIFIYLFEDITALSDLQTSWEAVNQKRDPIGRVGEYELLEQLGAGAFGCVYTVRKSGTATTNGSPQYFALKEIFMMQLNVEDDKSVGDVINEVKIIKQQLRHPNIVRYRRIFVENHRLYILMDLIEGASLKEHITSVKEKRQTFSEDRIWNMVIQMVLALRYLHKDKQIVHRDLKPNNIMIAENDRVVISESADVFNF
ncbi:unnamed protein product [Heligmosomoides polygyrus]|uniref:Protein kinase domain-containing protein n=1 Tax=Heligmosomoides polygyrus TaxID=6339 RepID=A0A3P8DHS4_HELPZ|nr:unnamed protein product [Heligmosomoides polygyrus]